MVDGFINFNLNEKTPTIIKVIGVGGGGGNAVEYMYEKGICDVDFVICNTDYQALRNSPIPCKIQLGKELTAGHGAGNNPAMGEKSAHSEEGYPDGLYHGCYGRRYRYGGCPGDCQVV